MMEIIYQAAFTAGVIAVVTVVKKLAWDQVHKIRDERQNIK